MANGILNSLKFQIGLALLALLLLFAAATSRTYMGLERQQDNDLVLNLAGQLQLAAQHLSSQAINYKRNRPMDEAAYSRDVRLYYQDLMASIETFDRISSAFAEQQFDPEITGLVSPMRPDMGSDAMESCDTLGFVWRNYRQHLVQALGPNLDAPLLENAADYVIRQHQSLKQATDDLVTRLRSWAADDLERIKRINNGFILVCGALAVAIVLWIFFRVLSPLNQAIAGFRRVAQGDFGLQLEASGTSEVTELTKAFNHLSIRLHVLFNLIDRLQEGSDLEQTLAFVSREFQDLLRIDWIGILFLTGDGSAAKLEIGFLDGRREIAPKQLYPLRGTLLEKALSGGTPYHVPDMAQTARRSAKYPFLRTLADRGLRDAVFLPMTAGGGAQVPGILAFATRSAHSYDPDQLRFLNNIAHLITHSFGRTVKLAERAHLAAIGEFASGIAHELRNPLATIGLALDYFGKLQLDGSAAKRAALAAMETERMARLLEEMLLYAKPMSLNLRTMPVTPLLRKFLETHKDLSDDKRQRFRLSVEDADEEILMMTDPDRIAQVWLNLARNACEAAPKDSVIDWSIQDVPRSGITEICVHNGGDPIPEATIPRLTEPFFTTKSSGSGLGLAIVKRLVDAHGGEISISSNRTEGTRVCLCLPRLKT